MKIDPNKCRASGLILVDWHPFRDTTQGRFDRKSHENAYKDGPPSPSYKWGHPTNQPPVFYGRNNAPEFQKLPSRMQDPLPKFSQETPPEKLLTGRSPNGKLPIVFDWPPWLSGASWGCTSEPTIDVQGTNSFVFQKKRSA